MQPMRVGAIAPGQILPAVGPSGPGQKIAVGAGAYTSITNVYGPAEAASGDKVNIQAVVKNLASYGIYIAVTGRYNGTDLPFTPDYANVSAGGSYSFNASFTMPNKKITIDIWSFYWTGTEWYQDDHVARSISIVYKWIVLATASLAVKKAMVGAWVPLASALLAVKKAMVGAWVPLATSSLQVKKALVGGWVPLATASLPVSVGVGVVPGKDIFKSLAVDFERSMPKEFEKTT